jgi:two-component system, OmpR family, alkaline phosphatase synthesis response regulator PhoP
VHKVLIIEDEESLVVAIRDRLTSEGYRVQAARDGAAGCEQATQGSYDVIILDVMLPEKDGFSVCRDLRQRGIQTPILMLTARGQLVDKVLGLKLGADDYLTKPFEMLELLARLEALLRRDQRSLRAEKVYRFGEIELSVERQELSRNGEPLTASAKEFELLRYFIEHPGIVLSRNRLLDEVWGYDAMPCTRTVDVHVSSLRQKIERDPSRPRHIITVHRRGYKFIAEP